MPYKLVNNNKLLLVRSGAFAYTYLQIIFNKFFASPLNTNLTEVRRPACSFTDSIRLFNRPI